MTIKNTICCHSLRVKEKKRRPSTFCNYFYKKAMFCKAFWKKVLIREKNKIKKKGKTKNEKIDTFKNPQTKKKKTQEKKINFFCNY